MANMKSRPTEPIPLHRVLREIYRHYLEFRDYVTATGEHVIDHGYFVYEDDGETIKGRVETNLSFWDLHRGIKELSDRKREAFFFNVIQDKKQKDVAEIMGITTVSVGQYVEQACLQLYERYFAEDEGKIKYVPLKPSRSKDVQPKAVEPEDVRPSLNPS